MPARTQPLECTFPGCGNECRANGLCFGHLRQLWDGRPLTPLRPHATMDLANCPNPGECSGRMHYARGMCRPCYARDVRARKLAGEDTSQGPRKVSDDDVRAIRAARASGVPGIELARTYNVSASLITEIVKGRAWAGRRMKVVDDGHVYELDHLGKRGTQTIRFVKRSGGAANYDEEWDGLQTQEVLRALIHRTGFLHDILPCDETDRAQWHLRMALFEHEARAYRRKVEAKNRRTPAHDDTERARLWRDREYGDVPFDEDMIETRPVDRTATWFLHLTFPETGSRVEDSAR